MEIYSLTRAELLFNLCYEIPCILLAPHIKKFETYFALLYFCIFAQCLQGPKLVPQILNRSQGFLTGPRGPKRVPWVKKQNKELKVKMKHTTKSINPRSDFVVDFRLLMVCTVAKKDLLG